MLKNSVSILLLLFCVNANAMFENEQVEVITSSVYDLDYTSFAAVAMRTNWSTRWVNLNGELVAGDTQSKQAKEEDIRASSFSATFLAPYNEFVDARFTVGKVILPIGIHEQQRLLPTAVGPRLMNDSFILNQYSSYIPPASKGALAELNFQNWSFDVGYYAPTPFTVESTGIEVGEVSSRLTIIETSTNETTITERTETVSEPETPNEVADSPSIFPPLDDKFNEGRDTVNEQATQEETTTTETVVESISTEVVNIETINPIVSSAELDTSKIFFQVSYDNGRDMVLDYEFLQSEVDIQSKFRREPAHYSDYRHFIGYERNFGMATVSSQASKSYYTVEDRIYDQTDYANGLSLDFNDYVIHASFMRSNGDLHDIREYTVAYSKIVNNNLTMRVAYRDIEGTYTPPEVLYATSIVVFDQCEDCNELVAGYSGEKEDRKSISKSGLEFRIEYRF